MASQLFADWLPDVAASSITISLDDVDAEAHGNCWSFSLSSEQAAITSVRDVVRFAEQVIETRRAWLTEREAAPMRIYWWHDAQAGQLRFSLVSAAHGRLPFGAEIVRVSDVAQIATDWLKSPYLNGIPWSELKPVALDEADVQARVVPLPVWASLIP